MALSGRLATISLGEVFQILDRGRKTGRLTLQLTAKELEGNFFYYLWFKQGRLVSITNRLDHTELLTMLQQRRWIASDVISELNHMKILEAPLGLHLKNEGILQAEQLKLLFHAQVLQRVCGLFKFQDGQFQFEPQSQLPKAEMTGLSISIAEATLLGLRVLKDWNPLQSRLPNANVALLKPNSKQLTIQLDTIERRVWDHATGTLSLAQIATQLDQPQELIRQVAFRLLAIGLVEELPAEAVLPKLSLVEPAPELVINSAPEVAPQAVSSSLLQNLLGFLRSKV